MYGIELESIKNGSSKALFYNGNVIRHTGISLESSYIRELSSIESSVPSSKSSKLITEEELKNLGLLDKYRDIMSYIRSLDFDSQNNLVCLYNDEDDNPPYLPESYIKNFKNINSYKAEFIKGIERAYEYIHRND